MNNRIIDCDVAIVGAGSAGLPAYREVLKAGLKPLLIEGGPHGTMCARVGCMPSKLLIAAAQSVADMRHADGFGIRLDGPPRVDGAAVMDRVRRERDRFVGFVVDDVRAMPPEHRLDAPVEFLRDGVLRAGDGREVHARRVILATGTRPNVPDLYRPLGDLAIVNDDVFDWRDLPRSVLVVGSGVIGVELGLALARLGVRVRVLNRSGSFAHLADPQVRAAAVALLAPELSLVQNARVASACREGDQAVVGWSADGGPETVERFDRVLLTAGRSPALDALRLERCTLPPSPASIRQRCRSTASRCSWRATSPAATPSSTRPPTTAAWPGAMPPPGPTCGRCRAARPWRWCSAIRRSCRWAAAMPRWTIRTRPPSARSTGPARAVRASCSATRACCASTCANPTGASWARKWWGRTRSTSAICWPGPCRWG